MKQELEAPAGPLVQIIIQGNSACNLNCSYCYLPVESRKDNTPLSLETAQIVFESIFSSDLLGEGLDISWHAGEPLIQPVAYYEEMFALIEELQVKHHRQNVKISQSFQTNGTLITDEWCDFFIKHNIRLGVSMDGPRSLQDLHRKGWGGQGSYERVMQGIRCLQKNQNYFGVLAVITKDTLALGADAFFHFFREHGIPSVALNMEEIEGANQNSSLSDKEVILHFRRFMSDLWRLAKKYAGEVRFREFGNISEWIIDAEQYRLKVGHGVSNTLIFPLQGLAIDNQGNFSTFAPELLTMDSPHYGGFVIGNFYHDTLESIKSSTKLLQMTKDIAEGRELCRNSCEYFDLCDGSWTSNKYAEHGTFVVAETMACALKPRAIVDIILEDLESGLLHI